MQPRPRLILVVDDSPADALLLSRALDKSGYTTITAHNGHDAIRHAKERNPELILLDMTMAGLDGVATCAELKRDADTAQIPVIFVTGNSDSGHIVKAFAAGGSDYVTKPIRLDEVLARLSVHLRLREAELDLVKRNRELETLATQLAETNSALARQSRIDGLTNLLNRRAWDEAAQIEHERGLRYGHPYAVLMLDLDYFKLLNDSLGHAEGDRSLQQVAECIARTCRTTDLAGRYGGEEFVVLAAQTAADAGVRLAERIRRAVWSLSIRHPKSPAGRVTVSIGVADSREGSLKEVLACADASLYRAKNGGRNLVFSRRSASLDASFAATVPATTTRDHAPRILVVEDNHANRMVYRTALEKDGYGIMEVDNGLAALEVIASYNPDLILMDVMMPVMDGVECTRRIKANPALRDIPIVMISARNDSDSVLAGLEAGAEEYLTKPVRTTELLVRIRSMVRLTAERRDLARSYELRAEQIRFLTILVDFCRALGNASTSDEALGCLVETVGEVTGGRHVSVMLASADRSSLTTVRSLGLDETALQEIPPQPGAGTGALGRVLDTGEALILNADSDLATDGAMALPQHLRPPLLAAPIGCPARTFGVLSVSDRVDPRPFEARDAEYVSLICGIAASTLHNIQNRNARDEARDQVVSALARLAEHRDSNTGRHVERVTQYSCLIAEALRAAGRCPNLINDAFLRNLSRAVPLHDIGKVAIPDHILMKPGKLTLDEMAVMRRHVDIGAEVLRPLIAKVPEADSLRMALDIIRAHHEWFDGSGYPRGLRGDAIPLSARIVAVADVYDALTRNRAYKLASSPAAARKIIAEASGTQFDPAVVDAFLASADRIEELTRQLSDDTEPAGTPAPHLQPAPALA